MLSELSVFLPKLCRLGSLEIRFWGEEECMEKVYWGAFSRLTSVGRERKQDWAKGNVGLQCSQNTGCVQPALRGAPRLGGPFRAGARCTEGSLSLGRAVAQPRAVHSKSQQLRTAVTSDTLAAGGLAFQP